MTFMAGMTTLYRKRIFLILVCLTALGIKMIQFFGHSRIYALGAQWYRSSAVVEERRRQELTLPRSCNLTQFLATINLEAQPPVVPRHLVGTCRGIIYNRVPKCASRFLKDLFEDVIIPNNQSLIFIDGSYEVDNQGYYISKMRAAKGQFVLISHFYFVDFTRFYHDPIVYINLVREPIEWFRSLYFFHQYGWNGQPYLEPLGNKFQQPFGECVQSEECFQPIYETFSPLRFFCGQKARCGTASEEVLQKVKDTIERYYLMVGVYEDLPAVNMVLEYLLPQVFANLTNAYIPKAADEQKHQRQATVKKDPLTAEAEKTLRIRLKYDYELYQFVKQRFYRLHNAIKTL